MIAVILVGVSAPERIPHLAARPEPAPAEGLALLPGTGTGLGAGAPGGPLRPLGGLGLAGGIDDADQPRDVLDLMALDAFVTGREPFARTMQLEHVVPDARLRPDGGRLLREAVDDDGASRLVVGDGWSLVSTHWRRSRRASLAVTAVSRELADEVARAAAAGAVRKPPPAPERVTIGFWYSTQEGPRRIERAIDAASWSELRGNYTRRAAEAVDLLVARTAGTVGGRLLLLHGPPGTGKTTLLRSLARHWRSWCQVDCVLDPDRLFGDPSYLLQVALGADDDESDQDEQTDDDQDQQDRTDGPLAADGERWRLLLLEDCDELIRAEAKSSSGQALSRLLNLTDGLLGQGRKVLVAITTNEDLARLHPAVVRPGRSLAHLEVGRLSPAEAVAWLDGVRPDDAMLADGATLAELYALRSGTPSVSVVTESPGYGCYL